MKTDIVVDEKAKKLWGFCGYGEDDGQSWETIGWKTSTQWKIRWDDEAGELLLAFQYSHGKLDWILNVFYFAVPVFTLWRETLLPFRAHSGMFLKWLDCRERIREACAVAKAKGYKITLCGHSQGGGFAVLVHALVRWELSYADVKTWAFAPLRPVFFWGFRRVKHLFEGVRLYVQPGDVVPRLPFRFLGFVTAGDVVKVGPRRFPWPWNWRAAHTRFGEYVLTPAQSGEGGAAA